MKPGQPLGRPASDLLMRVAGRLSNRLPTGTGVRNRWIRPRFIRAPHRQPQPFPLPVGALDPFFSPRHRDRSRSPPPPDPRAADAVAPLRRARLAPRHLFLPRQSGSPEHLPDRCGADLGQTALAQGASQGPQRPHRRAVPLAIRRPSCFRENPFSVSHGVTSRVAPTLSAKDRRHSLAVEAGDQYRDRIADRLGGRQPYSCAGRPLPARLSRALRGWRARRTHD